MRRIMVNHNGIDNGTKVVHHSIEPLWFIIGEGSMKERKPAYSLRMDADVRPEIKKLADMQDRSLNWQLNELLRIGLAQVKAKNENAPVAGNN